MSENSNSNDELTVEQFVEILCKSDLIEKKQIATLKGQLAKNSGKIELDSLVQKLITAGWITEWQSGKLLCGKHQGFFLDKYKLLSHLGTGGMSTVYLAEQCLTGQKRAIKVLPRKNIGHSSYLDRFYQEGRAVAALNHQNIIRVFDINHSGDTHFMVMEYVQGSDLYDVVTENGPVDFDYARDCTIQAAKGLSHAHKNNLIHRDIKPANLFRTSDGVIKVLDLGLALLKSDGEQHSLSRQFNENTMGTADYLSPEQAIDSHEIDHRSDIYSLGCTLFYLLTGRPPFNTGSLATRIANHQNLPSPLVTDFRSDCPDDLASACSIMLEKDPSNRFKDCESLIDALETGNLPLNKASLQARHARPEPTKQIQWNQIGNQNGQTRTVIGIGLLTVLSAIPIVLGIKLLVSPGGDQTEKRQATSAMTSESSGVPSKGGADHNLDIMPANAVESSPATFNDAAASATSVEHTNFEIDPRFFSSRADEWALLLDSKIIGELRHNRKCKIITAAEEDTGKFGKSVLLLNCLLYTSPSPRDRQKSRMPSSA